MDRNTAMPSLTLSGAHPHQMPSMGPLASMSAMDMSGMASTFSTSTKVTLWFTEWTTTTTATYVLAIFFLFFLGIFNRFLGALKSRLERRWKMQREAETTLPSRISAEISKNRGIRRHARQWSRALRQQSVQLDEPDREEIEPLSPAPPQFLQADEKNTDRNPNTSTRFWVAEAPWGIKRDGISAGLEFIRALISYVLMLAVMTYNIGFLFAVTGSVLLGEMFFGRYSRGSASLAEDGCHS
ncbi:ctr copper transporter family protein [Stemphylium lycopersici]|nr:ctr copper transporter family protein [Stemphylium lycopersici]